MIKYLSPTLYRVVIGAVGDVAWTEEMSTPMIKCKKGDADKITLALTAIRDITQGVELVNVAGNYFAAISSQVNQVTAAGDGEVLCLTVWIISRGIIYSQKSFHRESKFQNNEPISGLS